MSNSLAVVDCETTGFCPNDRIVEIAIVILDSQTLEVVDEFDTLVNPERDVGPVNIHGITASMVEAAPTFAEIAGAIARKLDESILVAQNLRFDSRMISQEFDRLQSNFEPGVGICTLRLTGQKLSLACKNNNIDLTQHHRALVDARAAAELLKTFIENNTERQPVAVDYSGFIFSTRTYRREAFGITNDTAQSELQRIVNLSSYPSSDESIIQYLDMLNWVLDDEVITDEERQSMTSLVEQLGLSKSQVMDAHENYLKSIIGAAQRDGVITESENKLINTVASALGVDNIPIPDVTKVRKNLEIHQGMCVCFTGTAIVDGKTYERSKLEALASSVAGLQPVSSVTKKGCNLLVAADPSSMSGKAKKARKWGISVISIEEFLSDLGGAQ